MRWLVSSFLIFLVSACEDVNQPVAEAEVNLSDYPETYAHFACLNGRAREFSKMNGNVIDLAYVAASGCKHTRYDLGLAIDGSESFALDFVSEGLQTDAQIVAEKIYRIRSGA